MADPAPASTAPAADGTTAEPFHGPHQAGVDTPPQAYAVFVAFDLRADVDHEALSRMMRLLALLGGVAVFLVGRRRPGGSSA